MYIKITIPQHFQLKLIPSLWNFLFLKKGGCPLYRGCGNPAAAFGAKGGEPLHPNAGRGGTGTGEEHFN